MQSQFLSIALSLHRAEFAGRGTVTDRYRK